MRGVIYISVGLISDIQKGSVYDGPGIRTVVFLKGCNMRCKWCHNPETIGLKPEELEDLSKCIGCGQCEKGCFAGARVTCGKEMCAQEVCEVVCEDIAYFGKRGGVTVSGGEPMLQPDFVIELLNLCIGKQINTAIETNLSVNQSIIRNIVTLCSLVMCDLKLYSSTLHQKYTGISNHSILNNLEFLDTLNVPFVVRTPIIRSVNANEDEIGMIAGFLSGLKNLQYYELLTYHSLGKAKPQSSSFTPELFEKATRDEMLRLGDIAQARGLSVKIDNVDLTGAF